MYQRIRKQFSPTAMALSVLAIVLAVTGAAFAAGGGLNPKQKKEVKKIAMQYAGKAGATGPEGKQGPPGANGTNGTNGKDGTNGKSVVVAAAGNSECAGHGGASVQVEDEPSTRQEVCNGQTGFSETLPKGKTETGQWVLQQGTDTPLKIFSPAEYQTISFPIPLKEAVPAYWLQEGYPSKNRGECEAKSGTEQTECEEFLETLEEACPGSPSSPEAAEGTLCIYAKSEYGNKPVTNTIGNPYIINVEKYGEGIEAFQHAGRSGVLLGINASSTNEGKTATQMFDIGTWAVTGS